MQKKQTSEHHHHQYHHHHHHHQHHHSHGDQNKWQQIHPNYASMDSSPQTFFYTLTNLLKLQESKNILQIGCGAGKLISTVLDLKTPETYYYVTDVSQGMVKQSQLRLKAHFQKYQSKLEFQDWIKKQKLQFGVENGEDIQKTDKRFDRIIANMVLCHANDPQKMLKNWHQIAQQNCLLGISLLGDPQKNPLIKLIRNSIQQAGQKLPPGKEPYYWYDKISKIVQNSGWKIILNWEQNALFPWLTQEDQTFKKFIEKQVPEKVRQKVYQRINQLFEQEKCGIQAYCRAIIAIKRS